MSSLVGVVGVLFCVLMMVTAFEIIPCDQLVLATDIKSVKKCPAQVSVSTVETDVFVDPPCYWGNSMCDTCGTKASSQVLDYSLTEFNARSEYKLVNDDCVNAVALSWKLTRSPTATSNNANAVDTDDNAAVDSSSRSDERSMESGEYDGSSSRELYRPDYRNSTIAFKMCFYPAGTAGCALAVEVKSKIPEEIDAKTIEFQYDCLSLKAGEYLIEMYTYPQLSDKTKEYQTRVYVDGSYSCDLSDSSETDHFNDRDIRPAITLPAPKIKAINDGPLMLIVVISITVTLIIALTIALVLILSRRSRIMGYVTEQSASGERLCEDDQTDGNA